MVLANGSTLPAGHQEWQLNEILALIFPATNGIGVMNIWDQTVEIATEQIPDLQDVTVSDDAYRTDLAEKAIASLSGSDTDGDGYSHRDIELKEGGE